MWANLNTHSDNIILNPKLNRYTGDVIWYKFFLREEVSVIDTKYNHVLINEQPMRNVIKISNNEFGFVKNKQLYRLKKVE